jgi:hypothetical protein
MILTRVAPPEALRGAAIALMELTDRIERVI